MSHPRVFNYHHKNVPVGAVYVGRGRDPRGGRKTRSHWGNPFPVSVHAAEAMVLFFNWLRDSPHGKMLVELARHQLPGKDLFCWCAPKICHAEVYARIADGELLEAIRTDILERIPERNLELF